MAHSPEEFVVLKQEVAENIARNKWQVACMCKVQYMHSDGDPRNVFLASRAGKRGRQCSLESGY